MQNEIVVALTSTYTAEACCMLYLLLQGVSLALSLHAPTQELRRTIVPSARAYPLHKLMDAVAEYQAASQQRVFVEYVVLSGVNDAPEQAHELGQLLQVWRVCDTPTKHLSWQMFSEALPRGLRGSQGGI
jgi:adenine C2-methylase RlmN of 23S rRNA A2503 and tRNA A37